MVSDKTIHKTRLIEFRKLFQQNPLENFYIFTIYQNYALALKTLFNIVEASFKTLLNLDVCVVWWCSDGPINSQEYNSFDIYAVTIKISWLNITTE